MPFDANKWSKNKFIPYQELMKKIQTKYEMIRNDDGKHATCKVMTRDAYILILFRPIALQAAREPLDLLAQ